MYPVCHRRHRWRVSKHLRGRPWKICLVRSKPGQSVNERALGTTSLPRWVGYRRRRRRPNQPAESSYCLQLIVFCNVITEIRCEMTALFFSPLNCSFCTYNSIVIFKKKGDPATRSIIIAWIHRYNAILQYDKLAKLDDIIIICFWPSV